jgi:hypothetical protein
MDDKARFLKVIENELVTTRKVIARIPEGSSYQPDPKSRTAREIAWLIVRELSVLADGLQKGTLEWAEVPAPETIEEILALHDREDFVKKFQTIPPPRWEQPVPFLFGGQQIMNETGIENAWGFLLDIVHHRGQITTYLRAMGSTVPQIYGPSADEPM